MNALGKLAGIIFLMAIAGLVFSEDTMGGDSSQGTGNLTITGLGDYNGGDYYISAISLGRPTALLACASYNSTNGSIKGLWVSGGQTRLSMLELDRMAQADRYFGNDKRVMFLIFITETPEYTGNQLNRFLDWDGEGQFPYPFVGMGAVEANFTNGVGSGAFIGYQ